MKIKSDSKMSQWVERWRQAGIELEHMRHEEIRQANTRQAIENLDDAFESSLRHHVPASHSGFEQQHAHIKSLFHFAFELQNLFVHQKWDFCFVGGLAVQRWGEPRLTQDVDVTLLTGFGAEESYTSNWSP